MKLNKFFFSILLIISLIVIFPNTVNAYITGAGRFTTLYVGVPEHDTIYGGPSLAYYTLDGQYAYCIELSVLLKKADYGVSPYDDPRIGYVLAANTGYGGNIAADFQIKQAAIWALLGQINIENLYLGDAGAVQAAKNLYYAAASYSGNVGAPGLSNSNLDFNIVGSEYVSNNININMGENNSYYDISLDGFPAGTYISDTNGNRMQTSNINWNSTIQVRIPLDVITSDISSINMNAISHGTTYNVSGVYSTNKIKSQKLVSSVPTSTNKSASSPFRLSKTIEARGNLEIIKKDEYGIGVPQATFKITLGSNTYTANTDSNGVARFDNIPAGTYTIEETFAPDGYYNDRVTINARVITGMTVTATKQEKDEKGRVVVRKEDKETTQSAQGDATLEGAVYKIYAREDIYASNKQTKLYSKGDEVATCTTNSQGVTNEAIIPLGKYMYKEITPSKGYNLNDEEIDFSIDYVNQDVEFVDKNFTSTELVKKNNIEIIKKLQRTDSTPQQNLSGAKFSATLKSDRSKVYYSGETDENGYTVIKDLPYGTYEVEEVVVPDVALKIDNFDVFVEEDKTEKSPYRYTKEDVAKKMQIKIYKEDIETGLTTQGDAHLENAEYTIYRDEALTDAVETVTISLQNDGTYTALTGWYLVGTYYIKETKRPEGYLLDEQVYKVVQIPKDQTSEFSYHDITSKELVEKGNAYIVKYVDNNTNFDRGSTTKNPATGVELTLTLDSKPSTSYTATIDDKGYAEFVDIPYGWYTITETKSLEYVDIMDPQPLYISKDKQKLYYIVQDPRNKRNLKIVKKDEETGKTIPLAGSTFKVWDVSQGKYLEQTYNYPTPTEINEFVTTNDGTLVLPDGIIPGAYELEEVNAPYGYARKETRIPFTIEATSPENPEEVKTVTVDFTDVAQKAKVVVFKKGEVLVDKVKDGDVTRPVYDLRGLAGVEYTITAQEDITTPDGTVRMKNGDKVVFKTDDEGIGKSPELYLGKYSIEETATIPGYLKSDQITPFVLEYKGQEVKVYEKNMDYVDLRQKLNLSVYKDIETPVYKDMLKEAYKDMILGIYTKEDLKDNTGKIVISPDTLVDKLYINEDGTTTSNYDLPLGKYYIKELKTNNNYLLNENTVDFEFLSNDDVSPIIDVKLSNKIENNLDKLGKFKLIKYAKDNASIFQRIAAVFTRKDVERKHTLAGAKFKFYWDNDGVAQELVLNDGTNEYTTDENGQIVLENLPFGKYYYQEIEVPKGYEIDDKLYEFTIDKDNIENEKIVEVSNKIKDIKLFTKTDAFNSQVIPDCVFEILDEDENVIYTDKTDKNGDFYMPIDMLETGKIYYYKETSAPNIYDLNDELHEFILNEDETVTIYKVENLRKNSNVKITKTDFIDGKKIPNCTFRLESKETDYKVEGTTDENGEYIFENIPYGKYTYTEISAPEEYNIDTNSHDITIDSEQIEIKVKDDKNVNTSDIKVFRYLLILVLSIVGISYLIYRYRKNKMK